MFLVIGLAGMLVLAIWATMQAYSTYEERTLTDIVAKYINQGDALMQDGKTDAAMVQYENAKRAAGTSKAGAPARRRLAQIFAKYAGDALSRSNYVEVKQYADRAIDIDATYSAGHYYKGVAAAFYNDQSFDSELRAAIRAGGNDDFAQAARKQLCSIYLKHGATCEAAGNVEDAKSWYRKIIDDQTIYDPDIAQQAQDRLAALEQ
jgi:tetratricopeptide (TPR) repeat protein